MCREENAYQILPRLCKSEQQKWQHIMVICWKTFRHIFKAAECNFSATSNTKHVSKFQNLFHRTCYRNGYKPFIRLLSYNLMFECQPLFFVGSILIQLDGNKDNIRPATGREKTLDLDV